MVQLTCCTIPCINYFSLQNSSTNKWTGVSVLWTELLGSHHHVLQHQVSRLSVNRIRVDTNNDEVDQRQSHHYHHQSQAELLQIMISSAV